MFDFDYFWNMKPEKYWSPTKSQNLRDIVKFAIYSGDYVLSEKIDGDWRMIIKDENGNFHMRGRSESVNGGYADKIEWVPHIQQELNNIPNGTVLLGELFFYNNRGSKNVTTIMGCLKDKALARQEDNKLSYYIFDVLAYDSEVLIDCELTARLEYLDKFRRMKDRKYVYVSNYISDTNEMEEYIAKVLARGGEGVVLKRKDGTYEPGKRTARKSIKVKQELAQTIDCYLTGNFKRDRTEYKGKYLTEWMYWYDMRNNTKLYGDHYNEYALGANIVPITKTYYNNWASAVELAVWRDGKEVQVAWISSVPDEVKREIVEPNNQWTHKVCEVQAMMIEEDTHRLRHGRIVNWRDDKTWQECDGHELYGA